jgi:hypothetical protein
MSVTVVKPRKQTLRSATKSPNQNKLLLKNSHGIKFEILPRMQFTSMLNVNGSNIIVNGSFLSFERHDVMVEIDVEQSDPLQRSISHLENPEFWNHLEIVVRKMGRDEIEEDDGIQVDGDTLVIDYESGETLSFKAGDNFETNIFVSKRLGGFARYFSRYDFNLTEGKPITLVGKFKSFTDDYAEIVIDHGKSIKATISVIVLAGAILLWAAAHHYGVPANVTRGIEKFTSAPHVLVGAMASSVGTMASSVGTMASSVGTMAKTWFTPPPALIQAVQTNLATWFVISSLSKAANSMTTPPTSDHETTHVSNKKQGGGGLYKVYFNAESPFFKNLIMKKVICKLAAATDSCFELSSKQRSTRRHREA